MDAAIKTNTCIIWWLAINLSNLTGTNLSGILNMYINAPAIYMIPPIAKFNPETSGMYCCMFSLKKKFIKNKKLTLFIFKREKSKKAALY